MKLWFSYPLNEQTVNTGNSMLNDISFQHFSLQEENYLLVLTANKKLPFNNIYLSVIEKPQSIDGDDITLWASSIPTKLVSEAQKALALTKKAADYLIQNTLFDLSPKW